MNVFTIAFSKYGFEVTSFIKLCFKCQTLISKNSHLHVYSVCTTLVFESLEYMTTIMTIKVLLGWIVKTLNCCVAGIDKLTL